MDSVCCFMFIAADLSGAKVLSQSASLTKYEQLNKDKLAEVKLNRAANAAAAAAMQDGKGHLLSGYVCLKREV